MQALRYAFFKILSAEIVAAHSMQSFWAAPRNYAIYVLLSAVLDLFDRFPKLMIDDSQLVEGDRFFFEDVLTDYPSFM
jgi:hypothetical protein